jgi:hypothetical protein
MIGVTLMTSFGQNTDARVTDTRRVSVGFHVLGL